MDAKIQAAAVASKAEVHDFNNKLSALLGLLYLARQLCPGPGELAEVLAAAAPMARKLGPTRPSLWLKRVGTKVLLPALLLFLYMPVQGGGFKAVARELAQGARRAGISRVAVLPFEPADRSGSREGWSIAEQLTTQIVRSGRVQAVERALLQKLLDEHKLERTGIVAADSVRRLGEVFSADGIVSGSFINRGAHVRINARLVNVETGLIVAACAAEVEREWFDVPLAEEPGAGFVYVPAPAFDVVPPQGFPVAVPRLWPEDDGEARDALADESCADAAARVDRMESAILELKARYWAAQLKKGLDAASLKENPGSTISDPDLKRRFYERMKYWFAQAGIPEMSPSEVRIFVAVDRRAFALHRECGI